MSASCRQSRCNLRWMLDTDGSSGATFASFIAARSLRPDTALLNGKCVHRWHIKCPSRSYSTRAGHWHRGHRGIHRVIVCFLPPCARIVCSYLPKTTRSPFGNVPSSGMSRASRRGRSDIVRFVLIFGILDCFSNFSNILMSCIFTLMRVTEEKSFHVSISHKEILLVHPS